MQDLGRTGKRRYGVGTSGAMDRLAAMIGNLMLGNDPGLAVLEITMPPFKARFHRNVSVSLTEADFEASLDGRPVSPWWAFALSAFIVEGVKTNIPLHWDILCDENFRRGGISGVASSR